MVSAAMQGQHPETQNTGFASVVCLIPGFLRSDFNPHGGGLQDCKHGLPDSGHLQVSPLKL